MAHRYPVVLTAVSLKYYSQGDERAFFLWLKRIACVRELGGVGHELRITIARPPKDNELRELIALFFRYKVDLTQLAQFETSENASWFRRRGMFWRRRMFGLAKSPGPLANSDTLDPRAGKSLSLK